MLIVQFTDRSVEVYRDYKRVSVDYPVCIMDFNMDTQKVFKMETDKRQVEVIKINDIVIWDIYSCPFDIDNDGKMKYSKKPIVKKVQWIKKL